MLTMLEHALWPDDTTEDERAAYIALGFVLEGRYAEITKPIRAKLVEQGWITDKGHMTDKGRSALAASYGWPVEDIERIDRSKPMPRRKN
jgi:hypothetical protein